MTSFFDAMVVSFRSKFSVGRKEINTLHRFFFLSKTRRRRRIESNRHKKKIYGLSFHEVELI